MPRRVRRYRTIVGLVVGAISGVWCAAASGGDPPLRGSTLDEKPRAMPLGATSAMHTTTVGESNRDRSNQSRRPARPVSSDSTQQRGVGSTWYVSELLASGANDGTSWADAFQGAMGMQAALSAAQAGDSIWIAAGTYLPSDAGDRDVSFVIPDGVALYGGFAGGEAALNDRDPVTNEVILSGDLLGDDGPDFANIADNSKHVVDASGVGLSTIIDSVTIASGYAEGNGALLNAAGLLLIGGSPTVADCRFTLHTARRGGAVYVESGSPAFTNCQFVNNRAVPDENTGEGNGGAVSIMLDSTPSYTGCTFTMNSARIGGALHVAGAGVMLDTCTFSFNQTVLDPMFLGALGGAMFIDSNDPINVTSCDFFSNTARQGGALDIEGGAPAFTTCDFIGNIAFTDSTIGGGLGGAATVAFGSSASFEDCDFDSNAGRVGGGVHVFDSTPTFTGCGFDDNEAVADETLGGGFGGAVNLLTSADAAFDTCTFNGNEARQGGAVQIEASQPTFDGCTFFVNTAPTDVTSGFGGAVLCFTDADASFAQCTFTGNTSSFGGAVFSFGATPMFTTCGFDLNGADQSGGALYLQDSGSIGFDDCRFETNTAVSGGGGAVYIDATPASLRGCMWTDNEAAAGSGGGVAMVDGSAALLFDCTFAGNESLNGGGVRVNGSPAMILACSWFDNSAGAAGGGIDFVAGSAANMHSCLFAQNDAVFGGGVHVSGLGPTLSNLTITENDAPNGAGLRASNAGNVTVANSIIWNNIGAETGTGPVSSLTISFSNVQGGMTRGGAGNIDEDPLFIDAPGGDYTLAVGSPCVDTGSNVDADPCEPDRALSMRIIDGAGSEVVDMGAYEHGVGVFTDCDGNLVLDACDIANMTHADCNNNGIPDVCDTANGGWADLDGNDVPDLCERISGDVNGDGVVDLADLLAVIGNWGGCAGDCIDPCDADIDFDCTVALGDLLQVIGNWGSVGP